MKTLYTSLFLIFILTTAAFAQKSKPITGVVKDSTGLAVIGATVKFKAGKDSTATATDANGQFTFADNTAPVFDLTITSIGFQGLRRHYVMADDGKPANVGTIILKSDSRMLKGVTITDVNPVRIKEDTVQFNAAAYKVRENAPVEDVLKKLPGVDVDKDGNVTAQGKSVTKVRVNGKDFFGGDLKTATRNLPADAIQNIQIIDDYGDQANITGIKTGEPEKVLNLTIKEDRNHGYFGSATVGDGSDLLPKPQTNQNRYVASANAFSFDGGRQLAVLANFNNNNTNLFSFGGGGPRGGGPGGPPPGLGNNNTNGITTARSVGLNYRDQWGKKITAYGSYSFSDNTTNTISSTIQNNNTLNNVVLNTISSNQTDEKINHRFNFNIEYKPDTVNYLKFSPSFSYAGLNTTQSASSLFTKNGATASQYNLASTLNSSTPNYGANLLLNHRFAKKGRNFSVNVSAGSAEITQTQNPVYSYLVGVANAPVNQLIQTDVKTDTAGTSVSYLEPIGKFSYLELNYAYHYAYPTSDKETDTLTNANIRNRYDLLSNNYNYTFITNRFGLNYRVIKPKYNYTLGISGQPTTLEGNSVVSGSTRTNTFNIAPTARFIYNFSRNQSLSINYNGASNQPTYTVLQPVIDFSNANYPVQGNPNLKPEFNNSLNIRYNRFDFESGNVFFSNLNFTQTDDKIVANSITYPSVYTPNPKLANTILTNYTNASGFYSGSAFYVFAKPWQKRRYNLFINGNATYNNNISYISNVAPTTYALSTDKNIAKSLVLTQGARFRVDITDVVDVEANSSYSITHTNNSLASVPNTNFRTINLGLNGKNYFFKDYTFSYDYTKVIYQGYAGATNPNIINTYVERRFLKNNVGTIRLAAYDLLNQNTGFTSTSTGSYVVQSQVNRLGRYYLVSFTLRLQKFAGKGPNMGPGPGGRFNGPPPGGGPGGPPPGGADL